MSRAPMNLLALQLKRIGDLVLTAPALHALQTLFPHAKITLAVTEGCAGLLPAFPMIEQALVLQRKGFNTRFWKGIAAPRYDACLDFTGSDRSALAVLLSRAPQRIGFEWMKKSRLRALAYNRWVDSPVRERHTVDHYLELLSGFGLPMSAPTTSPALILPQPAEQAALAALGPEPFVLIHPGTARVEKYWEPERWAAVIRHLQIQHGLRCVLTGGTDPFERAHLDQILAQSPCLDLSGKIDLLTFAAVIVRARAVLSCDTAAVHLASTFQIPQIALYGITNPFHWRPRHSAALVLSSLEPEQPLQVFKPKSKGAPMSLLSTELVCRSADQLLAASPAPI